MRHHKLDAASGAHLNGLKVRNIILISYHYELIGDSQATKLMWNILSPQSDMT